MAKNKKVDYFRNPLFYKFYFYATMAAGVGPPVQLNGFSLLSPLFAIFPSPFNAFVPYFHPYFAQ